MPPVYNINIILKNTRVRAQDLLLAVCCLWLPGAQNEIQLVKGGSGGLCIVRRQYGKIVRLLVPRSKQ